MDRALTITGRRLPSCRGNTNWNRLWPARRPLSLCSVSSAASSGVKYLSKLDPRNSERAIPVISSKFPLTKMIWGQSSAIITPSFKVSRIPSICSSHSGCSMSTGLPFTHVCYLNATEPPTRTSLHRISCLLHLILNGVSTLQGLWSKVTETCHKRGALRGYRHDPPARE